MDEVLKKEYRVSDCLLIGACKIYYRDRKRSAVYNKFARFLCEQANGDGVYAAIAIELLDKEREIMDYSFSWGEWCNILVLSSCFIGTCLTRVKRGRIKAALYMYAAIHKMIIKHANDLKEGRKDDDYGMDDL